MKDKYFSLGFVFDEDLDAVLLVKKERFPEGVEHMKGKLNGIGGHVEEDESPYDCMVRECHEETGMHLPDWVHFCTLETKNGTVYCFYSIVDSFRVEQKIAGGDKMYFPIFKSQEGEELNVYNLDPLLYYTYMYEPHMENLEWMIPMALNQIKGSESKKVFLIEEIEM